ncbi:MAG: hypothetical protein KAQ89_03145 [Planctomycetes bacterium]|nr:hypothetical protein [Planctomycetota bacterium]
MKEKFLFVLAIIFVFCIFVSGCLEKQSQSKVAAKRPINSVYGMIEHLQQKNLPTIKSIQPWRNQYGQGIKITTAHYEIFTTLLEPLMLYDIPAFMESAYRGYNSQHSKSVETQNRFVVYLFANRWQWENFTKDFAGRQAPIYCKIKAGAYYLNGSCVAYNIGRERTFSALGHEGWHQFNNRHFKFRLPSWLDEGLAMMFEANGEKQGMFCFDATQNMYRLAALKKTLIKKRMIPLKELVATNPGEVLAMNENDAVMAFYSQAYALVRFLREDGYGKRLGNFQRMLSDGMFGNWPLNETGQKIAADRNIPLTVQWNRAVSLLLFEYYIDDDFDKIEKEYEIFCRKMVYHVKLKP